MDDKTRDAVLIAAEQLFGREQLFKLASSVGSTRVKKNLRFWQEKMLAQLSEYSGIDVNSVSQFIAAFKGTKARYAPAKPDNSPAGILKYMQAVWANESRKEQWVQGAARELSKIGTLDSYVKSYRALAKFLTWTDVRDLYESLRDQSMRPESEWRHEFLKYFKKILKEESLPAAFDDEHWTELAVDPRTFPINLATGLPWDHDK